MESSGIPQEASIPPVEGVSGGGTSYGLSDDNMQGSHKVSIDPTEVPSADLVHVWSMPSTSNVGKQDLPRPLEPINLLAARSERESVQIFLRPKVSWAGCGSAGNVQVQCSDMCSPSGDKLIAEQSVTMRLVVPVLGVPDALVPLNAPTPQISLAPGETTAIWVSIDVPSSQPPGQYEGEFIITAMKADAGSQYLGKSERHQLFRELRNCLDIVESFDGKPLQEVVEISRSATTALRRVLLSPSLSEFFSENGQNDMMEEDAISNLSVRLKFSLTVWEFILPETPSLPAVFGISDTVIEDRFGVKHGSEEWYHALDMHFKWLLQYRISPYFCRWGNGMRVLTYTCPWPAHHPKSDEYYSDPRLAAYAVPYSQVVLGDSVDVSKDYLQKEVEILKRNAHWKKAYFYLWDEPLNMEHYDSVRNMASDLHAYAPDARVLTTYYCGPNDAPLAPTPLEAFVKVPKFLRPHTQIYCTSEWVLGNREDLAKEIIAELQPQNGEEWWTYVCLGPSDPHPNWHLGMRGTQHRAVMWRVWKEGGTGFLYWGTNCYEKATVASAEIRFRQGLPPGDGVLYYPGEVFSNSHQPVASVRLERILSGLQDIEYLKLYASRYGRDEGIKLMEKTGMYLGPERYTVEHLPIDMMRGEVFRTCQT